MQQSKPILVGDQYTGATIRTHNGRAGIFIGSIGPGCEKIEDFMIRGRDLFLGFRGKRCSIIVGNAI